MDEGEKASVALWRNLEPSKLSKDPFCFQKLPFLKGLILKSDSPINSGFRNLDTIPQEEIH